MPRAGASSLSPTARSTSASPRSTRPSRRPPSPASAKSSPAPTRSSRRGQVLHSDSSSRATRPQLEDRVAGSFSHEIAEWGIGFRVEVGAGYGDPGDVTLEDGGSFGARQLPDRECLGTRAAAQRDLAGSAGAADPGDVAVG